MTTFAQNPHDATCVEITLHTRSKERMMAGLPHGGFKIGDVATWADERCRVIGLYEGCDEIVIELLDEPMASESFH